MKKTDTKTAYLKTAFMNSDCMKTTDTKKV